jgi:GABA(A) receptor-associated protein
MSKTFKEEHTLEKRKVEADRIRKKYPDRIPIICQKVKGSDVPEIDKKKYLVPADLSCSQYLYVIRRRIKLAPDQAIFLFVNNTLPPAAATVSQVYKDNVDEDGFLYFFYSGEETFGNNFSC